MPLGKCLLGGDKSRAAPHSIAHVCMAVIESLAQGCVERARRVLYICRDNLQTNWALNLVYADQTARRQGCEKVRSSFAVCSSPNTGISLLDRELEAPLSSPDHFRAVMSLGEETLWWMRKRVSHLCQLWSDAYATVFGSNWKRYEFS